MNHTRDVDIIIDYLARIAVAAEKLSEQVEVQNSMTASKAAFYNKEQEFISRKVEK